MSRDNCEPSRVSELSAMLGDVWPLGVGEMPAGDFGRGRGLPETLVLRRVFALSRFEKRAKKPGAMGNILCFFLFQKNERRGWKRDVQGWVAEVAMDDGMPQPEPGQDTLAAFRSDGPARIPPLDKTPIHVYTPGASVIPVR